MKAENHTSLKEHKTLLGVVLLWTVIVILCFCSEVITNYNESVAAQQKELAILAGVKPGPSFSISAIYKPILEIHLLSFLIFTTLLKKRFFISLLTTFCYFIFLVKALINRFNNFVNEDFWARTDFLSKIDIAASGLDLFAFVFLLTIFFWQSSILLRMLIKTIKRKNILP